MILPILQVIVGSTRPGRVGLPIAQWFTDLATAHGEFEVEMLDLAEFDLPVYNEPGHPIQQQYTHEHTKRWSAAISRGDAIVFVVPEYNHSFNAATKNALDFLYHEWRHKAAGIVSYGGAAMGTRATQALKPVLAALKLVHAGDVTIPLVTVPVKDGLFEGNDILRTSANALLEELAIMTPVLIERRQRTRAAS